MKTEEMLDEYDFSSGIKNPYLIKGKKQITIRLDENIIDYFTKQASKTGISYQNLINMYLRDCVENHKTLKYTFE